MERPNHWKIGVDARLLTEPVTGIGRYTDKLTAELIKSGGQWFLYAPKPVSVGEWEQDDISVRTGMFKSRPWKMVWSQTLLPLWAARDRVDLFWGPTHRLPRFLPKRTARVVTIHDLVWKHAGGTMRPLSRWLEQWLMPEAVRLADRIIADSQSTANAIAEEYPWAHAKIKVVHLGISELPAPSKFDSLAAFGIDGPYFFFVGTLEPRKNLRRLLQAYASLEPEVKNQAQLVIAGGKGWGPESVGMLTREYGLEGQVKILGYVSESTLATLYAHARFLAMPSLYEGFGLPLVEAMSFGVPVLTSSCSSLPEVAGDAGLLVDPLDVSSIADGLSKMLANDELRRDLASRAKLNAARFSWQKAAKETLNVFAEAMVERQRKFGSC